MIRGGFFLFIFSFLFLISCTPKFSQDDIIARIDKKTIRVGDFFNLFETLKPKEVTISGRERAEIKNLAMKTLIRRAVILNEAERKNIAISEAELEQGIKKIKEGYSSTAFDESLLEHMVDQKEWREQVRQNLLIDKLFEKTEPRLESPTLKQAIEFYQNNPNLFRQNASAEALHIVVADRDIANEIRKKLSQNPALFLAQAREFSTGPEAKENALIKVEKDVLPEELDEAIFNSKIGEISKVIQSPYGFHILKVQKRTPALNQSFDDAKASIIKKLTEDNRRIWLSKFEEKLIRGAQIEYNRDLIAKL